MYILKKRIYDVNKHIFVQPCNSVKDRIGKSMIEEAEKKGLIAPGNILYLADISLALCHECFIQVKQC